MDLSALKALSAQGRGVETLAPRLDSYGPPAPDFHGDFAFMDALAREGDRHRAAALAYWRSTLRSKASFPRCQYIAGAPSTDDSCKCGARPVNGIYCADHLALCTVEPTGEVELSADNYGSSTRARAHAWGFSEFSEPEKGTGIESSQNQ